MNKQLNLIIGITKLTAFLIRHTVHEGARWTVPQVDHYEDENAIHSVCRCLYCGKTFGFKTKKSQK
jgi:hypothetical protein